MMQIPGAAAPNPLIALLAGVVSFLTPCIFPIIPSYLSFIAGISYEDLKEGKGRRFAILGKTLLFVAGFAIVFSVFSLFTTGIGRSLSKASNIVNIVSGSIVVILGLNFIFDFIKILNFEKKFHFKKRPGGYIGAFFIGIAFGAGWTPCIGPILGTILFYAMSSGDTGMGLILLLCYSAGLGIPFILAGLFFSSFSKLMDKIKPYLSTIKVASGIFLIIVGLLIAFGRLSLLNSFLGKTAYNLELWNKASPGEVKFFFGLLWLVPGLLILWFYIRKAIVTKKIIHPVRLIFICLFLGLSLCAFLSIIDFAEIFSQWFNFEGLEV